MNPFVRFNAKNNTSITLTGFKKYSTILCFLIGLFLTSMHVTSQTLPANFSQVLVANGISNPTVMAFAPDGRIFVAQQTGQLRIIKNGSLLATPFISLTVDANGERGLLGIAFDPAFATNNFVYLYYTPNNFGRNRISRFTANGDVVVAGSELILLNLDPLSGATNHNGGTMQFGPDGKLYVGVGENANGQQAQNTDLYHGKILRINSNGSVPAGNPLSGGSEQRQRLWAYGLRNPYTIAFQPGTGKLFVNDVGQNTWEEIDDATTGGKNFGWPGSEGYTTISGYTSPVYAYAHSTGSPTGCAITGGTFFNPSATNYPSTYAGRYFFIDYCSNWIETLTLSGSTATRSNFASNIGGNPVSIITGPDGNLYFLSRSNSAVYKITYTSSSAPVITGQPQSRTVAAGSSTTFTVTATGTPPLSYQWRKNGVNITGATSSNYTIASVTATHAGTYSVIVSNASGNVTSNNATLTVTAPNQKPDANISTPVAGTTYAGGQVINFSGTGTDPEDGTLGAAAFSWFVTFYHDTHSHPGPTAPSGVTSGSFTIPNSGETAANVFYRLSLVVADSKGLKDTATTDILPRTSVITINTNPQGLAITLDGQPFTAPKTVTGVEGIIRSIGVTSPQSFNGSTYTFSNWSHGGAQTQTITTPVNDVSYNANFTRPVTTVLNPTADTYVRSGNSSNSNYGTNTQLYTRNQSAVKGLHLTYLRFDISTLSNVSSVKLRLYGRFLKSATSSVQVFNVVSQTWQENTITYNNRPQEQTTVLASVSVSGTTGQYYEWDLTQHITALRSSGATSVSLLVKNVSATNSRLEFISKENSSNKPELRATGITSAAAPAFTEIPENNIKNATSFSVYPNPASTYFIIKYSPEFNNQELRITDINGRVVKKIRLLETNTQSIPVYDLKEGIYFIHTEFNRKKYSQKILIRK